MIGENKWDCLMFYRENDKICIAYFDFDKKIKEIDANKKIEKVDSGTEKYYLANFKKKDFIKIMDGNYFPR